MTLDNIEAKGDFESPELNSSNESFVGADVPSPAANAYQIMSTWSGEASWTLPEQCNLSFDIRQICPGVVEHLVRARHFSARDLRTILERVRSGADHRDPHAAYNAILDITERKPWLWPHLESLAMTQRTHDKPHVRRKGQNSVVYSKFPLHKMRLDLNKQLQPRLSELLATAPVDPEVGFAAFAEFAVQQYFQKIEGWSSQEMSENISNALTPYASFTYLKEIVAKCTAPLHWIRLGKVISEASEFRFDIPGAERLTLLRQALNGLFGASKDEDDSQIYDTISLVASRCAATVRLLEDESSIELQRTLSELGISTESSEISATHLEFIQPLAETGVLRDLVIGLAASRSTESELAELRLQIAKASQDDDFDQVATLSASAKSLKERAAVKSELLENRVRALQMFLADSTAGPEHIRSAFDLAGLEALHLQTANQEPSNLDLVEEDYDFQILDDEDTEFVDEISPQDLPADESENEPSPPHATEVLVEPQMPVTLDQRLISPSSEHESSLEAPETAGEADQPVPTEISSLRPSAGQLDARLPLAQLEVTATVQGAEICGDTLNEHVLIDLISRDLVGIAADVAETAEENGTCWPIEASVLSVAAASRTSLREYGDDTQRFLSLVSKAEATSLGALGSALLVGAVIRPAVMSRQSSFRGSIVALAHGALGTYLQEVAEAISALEYDFPPGLDDLARLAGADRIPVKMRLSQELGDWCEAFARKTSRWPFATKFMHYQASSNGLIGEAQIAIEADSRDAVSKARVAIERLGSQSAIDGSAHEYDLTTSKPGSTLHPKGLEYLHRQFDEPLGTLDAWIRATETDSLHGRQSETRLRSTVGNLVSRLGKAATALRLEKERQPSTLEGTVANWIAARLDETLLSLEGREVRSFANVEDALKADRNFLPATLRDEAVPSSDRLLTFLRVLNAGALPDARGAFMQACDEGAFETAADLQKRFAFNDQDILKSEITAFVITWRAEIEDKKRRLKALARVDYSHQEEISRRLDWCESTIKRLENNQTGNQVENLTDVPAQVADLQHFIDLVVDAARAAQRDRIEQYRNIANTSDADLILVSLENLTPEAIEDRIAQLRDGRSAAIFESEFEDIVSVFTPSFVTSATEATWPKTAAAYRGALAEAGPLAVNEDRRAASLLFISNYLDVVQSINGGTPAMQKVQRLFEEIGFEKVKTHEPRRAGSGKLWQAALSAEIRSDGWFLPPIFGSRSRGKFTLLLVGHDTLPEAAMKCLDAETPAIVLLCGVADFARRRDFAERLRANAIPALLIDEALIAFAATRRDTRARTIFECGLPYGRITPYVTDAGTVPQEMFFGREVEIRTIMSRTADGCLVYGGRQLGKSALLNHIESTRHDPNNNIIVVKIERKALGDAEKASEIWSHLKSMLPPGIVKQGSRDPEAIAKDIELWCLTYPAGRIICMFDESDNFMTADTRAGYPELSRLKVLMEDTDRAFKVIFAGTHNVQRMHKQSNSPLAHLGSPICIGPLSRSVDDKRAAYELIIAPMKAAGFRFKSIQAVEEILAWANYYPSLLQEYGKGLLASLHGFGSGKAYKLADGEPLWRIGEGMLFGHVGFQAIEARVREKFNWTLELDPRYALVANTLALLNLEGNEDQSLVTGFTPAELRGHALKFWHQSTEQPSIAAFEALLEEMFDLGVLGRVAISNSLRFRYLLRTQQVAAMLGSLDDIENALLDFGEKDPTVAYDRSVYRRRYRSGTSNNQNDWPYSPLTDLQIERIVSEVTPGVQIVCGLDILGLNNVGKALKYLIDQGKSAGTAYRDLSAVETTDIRKWIDGRALSDTARTIVIYTPNSVRDANNLLQLCETQPKVIAGDIRPLILLDAADLEMRALAIRRKDQSQYLEAWGGMMIRNHLHQIECTQLDRPKLRESILKKSGGIGSETVKLIGAMMHDGKPEERLSTWSNSFKIPSTLLEGSIGEALEIIQLGGDDYSTLDGLIRESTGQDLVSLGPDLVATGLVLDWNPKIGSVKLSALGELVVQSMGA